MMQRKKTVFLLAALWFSACGVSEKDLSGTWRAAAFFQNGKSLNAPLDSVALTLGPGNQYEFRSQGHYREAGFFRSSARYLFLTDTTETPAKEHTVKVLFVSNDSLKIQMKATGGEQVLFFSRRR